MKKYSVGSLSLAYDCFAPEAGLPLVFLHGATSMMSTFEQLECAQFGSIFLNWLDTAAAKAAARA